MIEQKIYNAFSHSNSKLYIFDYPDEYILLIEERKLKESVFLFKKLAANYMDILKIGIGNARTIKQQSISYTSAKLALNSLYGNKNFAIYDDLDIDMILGDLKEDTKCRYLEKTLKKLSEQELEILTVYFEENMSLNTASQRLFIHKNTLQYKLDKIYEICGYNPRKFKDASVLYYAIRLKRLKP